MIINQNLTEQNIENLVTNALNKVLSSKNNEWMTLKEGANYAGVSYNTFMKFRTLGLKVCEVDGVKRVSRKEIDTFLRSNSY